MDHTEYLDKWWWKHWSVIGDSQVMLWDLDSTVSSTLRRRPMVEEVKAGNKTWDDYSLACHLDEPIAQNVTLMGALTQYTHIALSGRSVLALELTMKWSQQHAVPLSGFLLRPDDTVNGEWKVEAIQYLKYREVSLVCMFEDWPPVAEHIMARTGLPVVCLNPMEPEESRLPYAPGAAAISESL